MPRLTRRQFSALLLFFMPARNVFAQHTSDPLPSWHDGATSTLPWISSATRPRREQATISIPQISKEPSPSSRRFRLWRSARSSSEIGSCGTRGGPLDGGYRTTVESIVPEVVY